MYTFMSLAYLLYVFFMVVVCVCPCLTLSREWKGVTSSKLTGRKAMTRVTRPHLEVERSQVKVTRSVNAVTGNQPYLWNGKPTNFKLGIWMEYDDSHHQHTQ